MPGRVRGWRRAGPRRQRPRPRLIGCLLWIIAVIVVLIIVSLLFGGFRKGTRSGGAGPLPSGTTSIVLTMRTEDF